MRNLTVRERAILVAAMVTFLVGAGHRYWKAKSASPAAAGGDPDRVHAKG